VDALRIEPYGFEVVLLSTMLYADFREFTFHALGCIKGKRFQSLSYR
jgi:hypothetical protein